MKTTPLNRAVQAIAASALLSFGSAGWAASTWNVSACTSSTAVAMGNSFSCASTGEATTTAATATAWGSTSAAKFAAAALSKYNTAATTTTSAYSEFGVKNVTEGLTAGNPQHSMDNNGQTDLISFNFGTAAVALNSVSLGWVSGDSDLSVLRFDATKGFDASISGKTIAGLMSTGWELVKNTSGGSTAATYEFNKTPGSIVSSSWWLISAFNSGYGGGTASSNDYVKLMAFAGNVITPPSGVPEPGSLALVGAGLLGFLATRRKAKGKSLGLAA